MRPPVGMVPRKSSDDGQRFGLPPGTQITTARLDCGLIRVYTLVLHQPNPVASRKPYFIGFFASQQSLAEREGFEPPLPTSKTSNKWFLADSRIAEQWGGGRTLGAAQALPRCDWEM
jgi:hypothetical protein